MNLTLELETFLNEFAMRVPLPRQRIIERSIRALAATGIAERALKAGQQAPEFSLPDAEGNLVTLAQVRQQSPVVLIFFRGVWCPFCNLMLRAYQERLPDFQRAGAGLVAISPQSRSMLRRTAQRNRLSFTLLSDHGCAVAADYGLAYELDEELAALYRKVGDPATDYNAAGDWVLPIPSVFLVDQQGKVALAHVEPDFRRRLNPDAVLKSLAQWQGAA